ncbi:SEC-C metal-binding domain-containing protein [Sporolactobacillus sp. STSJ-5]|uniref:SEC-C metal-binding domain-containing protein n=1 Tax=Sporolactobacillus sp. STSJ-5 TaxID=2965076 RepID=UPI0021036B30|nr:SEC-C metal-binding domain-containing protein [Sporolactobacillus sp. STSJ-5]MCQ2009478.1 SEC-C metal-binding domain-containing protein [Sporolactobacillus sp. STSJ-5]
MIHTMEKKKEATLLYTLEGAKDHKQKLRDQREKRFWKIVELPCGFKATLNRLTKDELDQIRRNYQFKGISSLKKAEMASELARLIPLTFQNIIVTLDQRRYDLIETIVKHSGMTAARGLSVSTIEVFMNYSILFPGIYEDNKVLFMPEELMHRFEQRDGGELKKIVQRNTEWIQLAHGLLHYFGVMDACRMVDKIEMLTGQHIDQSDFMNVMVFACDFYGQARLSGYGFQDSRVFDAEKIVDEYRMRPDVEDYPFTRKQLMKAADRDYVDQTPEMNRFIHFLLSYYQLSEKKINELTVRIIAIIQTDENPSKVIQFLQSQMTFPSFDFVQQLLVEVTEVYNHTRQWRLKAHMPHELFQKEKRHLKPVSDQLVAPFRSKSSVNTDQANHHKVGRNDPCPCGSGKKYKKCCGR